MSESYIFIHKKKIVNKKHKSNSSFCLNMKVCGDMGGKFPYILTLALDRDE